MKAAIDYKKANSELTGVDTFEGILGYIVATVISNSFIYLPTPFMSLNILI